MTFKAKILFFLLFCIVNIQAIERSSMDEYLYGPYFDDPNISSLEFTNPSSYFKKKRCNIKKVIQLNNRFLEPGLFSVNVNLDSASDIITCAWKNKKVAYNLLEKVVYADQLAQETTSKNITLRKIIYHPIYLLQVTKEHPSILSAIPDSHPQYLEIAREVILHNPIAFEYITLRFKRHPEITEIMFNISSTYDDIYKHYAMQYTMDDDQRRAFIKHNGMLYLELPIELRDNPYLAYYAYVQNDTVYPYIPKRIKKLFKNRGAIKVPRYMTKVVLIQQKIGTIISSLLTPLLESFQSSEEVPSIEVEIEGVTEKGNTDEMAEPIELFDDIRFRNELTVVTDPRVINKIESRKNRRLLYLWRISRFGENGQVFIGMFRPHGKDHLGAIIVKQNERLMFSDYAAVFSMDGENIWRIKDKGKFNGKAFILDRVVKHDEGQLKFSFKWSGEYTTNEFDLIDRGGNLIKEFIDYNFD